MRYFTFFLKKCIKSSKSLVHFIVALQHIAIPTGPVSVARRPRVTSGHHPGHAGRGVQGPGASAPRPASRATLLGDSLPGVEPARLLPSPGMIHVGHGDSHSCRFPSPLPADPVNRGSDEVSLPLRTLHLSESESPVLTSQWLTRPRDLSLFPAVPL